MIPHYVWHIPTLPFYCLRFLGRSRISQCNKNNKKKNIIYIYIHILISSANSVASAPLCHCFLSLRMLFKEVQQGALFTVSKMAKTIGSHFRYVLIIIGVLLVSTLTAVITSLQQLVSLREVAGTDPFGSWLILILLYLFSCEEALVYSYELPRYKLSL